MKKILFLVLAVGLMFSCSCGCGDIPEDVKPKYEVGDVVKHRLSNEVWIIVEPRYNSSTGTIYYRVEDDRGYAETQDEITLELVDKYNNCEDPVEEEDDIWESSDYW